MNKITDRLYNGIVKENPTFVQMLGMCPTLAVTTTAINGLGMGLATTVILTLSNLMISLLRKVIPDKVRIPAYIVVIASFVTMVQFIMQAYTAELYKSLGLFIPLIVVNCIILGRAESYASKNSVVSSIFDGIGMGLGFTLGLTLIGIVREFFGSGSVFGLDLVALIQENKVPGLNAIVSSEAFSTITIFKLAPSAFFVLAFLIAFLNHRNIKKAKAEGKEPELCKLADCASCQNTMCQGKVKGE
ncbi:MAG: electron transport complex subunit E [Lachnospiraceae bacterium]|nr:electron transport complex subunit E [Lachnospiraceae bacterium]